MGKLAESQFFFTAAWEPIAFRRGDALGLRALTDEFAEFLAPGLSNRTFDLRWVSILSWCLTRSQAVAHAAGHRYVGDRRSAARRYSWLRPLELMWIARTIALVPGDWRGRQLPGQRRVLAWIEGDRRLDRFAMTADQYGRYRQTGIYGAYRVAFRRWAGLSQAGDGWTPGRKAYELAEWLDSRLGAAALPLDALERNAHSQWQRWEDQEHRWWIRHWREFDAGSRRQERELPRKRDEEAGLPEADALNETLFSPGEREESKDDAERRRETASYLARSKAQTHAELCQELAQAYRRAEPDMVVLPSFSRLADAGMAAMDSVYSRLSESGAAGGMRLKDVLDSREVQGALGTLRTLARRWPKGRRKAVQFSHFSSADRFAAAVSSTSNLQCLKQLLRYHERAGGGLRWFLLRDEKVIPNAAYRPGASARYRFRLAQLARMAIQCGEIRRAPRALTTDDADEGEMEEEQAR